MIHPIAIVPENGSFAPLLAVGFALKAWSLKIDLQDPQTILAAILIIIALSSPWLNHERLILEQRSKVDLVVNEVQFIKEKVGDIETRLSAIDRD